MNWVVVYQVWWILGYIIVISVKDVVCWASQWLVIVFLFVVFQAHVWEFLLQGLWICCVWCCHWHDDYFIWECRYLKEMGKISLEKQATTTTTTLFFSSSFVHFLFDDNEEWLSILMFSTNLGKWSIYHWAAMYHFRRIEDALVVICNNPEIKIKVPRTEFPLLVIKWLNVVVVDELSSAWGSCKCRSVMESAEKFAHCNTSKIMPVRFV